MAKQTDVQYKAQFTNLRTVLAIAHAAGGAILASRRNDGMYNLYDRDIERLPTDCTHYFEVRPEGFPI